MKTLKIYFLFFLLTLSLVSLDGQANFLVSSRQGCVPLTVKFTDLTPGAVQWSWDFGNGNTSTLQNPSAIYYASGKFTISLTTWDVSGNQSAITKTNHIQVFKNPIANFSATPNPVCEGDPVAFTSSSTPGDTTITQYSWDFGNGILSSKANPSFAYNTSGLYAISLVVTDGHGCQDKILKNNYLRVKPSPKALFNVDSGFNCKAPTTFWFRNSSIGGSLTYSWNFGDGNGSTQKSPTHAYTNFGTYSPFLTVTDTNGCKNTFTASGAIYLGPIKADFTGSPVKICGNGNVQFNLIGGPQPSLKYEWNFGDGSTTTGSSPSHLYSKPGKYTVKLIASSTNRPCTSEVEKKQFIKVDPKPSGVITISDSFPCKPPFTLALKYNDTMPLESIIWSYTSNGNSYKAGTGGTIYQTITDYDPRNYKAVVTTKEGCIDTIYLDWVVEAETINAVFDGDTLGCVPVWAQLIDKSISKYPITSWRWVFHDKSEAVDQNPNFLYLDTGRFPVKLFIKTSKGCEDSVLQHIHVGMKTNPDFYLGVLRKICNNSDEVSFFNSTINPKFEIDSFRWVYDDNEKTTLKIPLSQKSYRSTNVKHRYDRDTGMIVPILISYHNGCADSISKPDSLFMKPPYAKAVIENNPCFSDSILVLNKSVGEDSLIWEVHTTDDEHKIVYDTAMFHTDSFKLENGYNYNIYLTVFNKLAGCFDTLKLEYSPPKSYTFCKLNQSSHCAPAEVTLCINESPAGLYYWTLNNTDTLKHIEKIKYILDTPGVYTLSFVQDFGKGCVKKSNWQVKVQNGILKGSVSQPQGCIPTKIKLIDSGWTTGSVKHAWHMNNGDVVKATSKEMEYTIQNVFGDSLIITLSNDPDEGLCRPFKTFIVPVSGPGLRMNWAWNSLSCTEIRFVANATMNPNKGVKPFTFLWNTGDGSTYNSQFISHKFKDTGWYDVSISVTDANGCKVIENTRIYVPENRLNIKFTADTLGASCPPLYVNFKDLSTSGNVAIKYWEWDFGDGVKSTLKNPQHQYLVPGRFPVTLKITDEQGCTRTVKFPDFITISGPFGKYKFDNTQGCYPLRVNFTDSVSQNTAVAEWDYGDGVVTTGFDPTHVYKKPGRYIPALVLKDTLGCKFPVPPIDTIYVYDYPIAQFTYNGICLRDTVLLQSKSVTRDEPLQYWKWEIDNKNYPSDTMWQGILKNKNSMVRHIVTTNKGCSDTIEKVLPLKQPQLGLSTSGDTICLGASWTANGSYTLDTLLNQKAWFLNGAIYSNNDDISYSANKSGQYRFTFKVEDVAGCWDSISKPWPLTVGDTLFPPITTVLRVSVEDDISHHIKFRKHPDFDFMGYTILRDINGIWTPIKTISNLNDTLIYLNGVDALRYSYCYKVSTQNLCGFTQKASNLISHCTVEVGGKPAINASILKWSPYAGWPVKCYDIFRENGQNQFDSIGTVNGKTLNYIDTSIVCHEKHEYRIKAHEAGGNSEWSWSDTCHVKPIYINVVPPPVVRRATVVNDQFVRMEWDQLTQNRQPLDYYEVEKLSSNGLWKWASTSTIADTLIYHDKKTFVDDYSYIYRIRAVDECGDTSGYSNVGKSILLTTTVNEKYQPVLNWTHYKDWSVGVSNYVIEKRNGTGVFVKIGETGNGTDTNFVDNIGSLNCVPLFEYRVYAIRNPMNGNVGADAKVLSYSNVDAPPVETKIYIPNAFTPDGNVLNDGFRPDGIYIAYYEMKIYTRWGEKVYEGNTCMNSWDGMYNSQPAPEGVYVYIVTAKGSDGNLYQFKGDVTLLR